MEGCQHWKARTIIACALMATFGAIHSQQGVVAAEPVQQQKHQVKNPRAAVSSDTDLHLALTSLDDRLIAYQYTDPGALSILTKPTATSINRDHHNNILDKEQSGSPEHDAAVVNGRPYHADQVKPEPEPTPICHEGDPCHLQASKEERHHRDQPTTEWTDLHITSLPPPPAKREEDENAHGQLVADFLLAGGQRALYSPREQQQSASTMTTATTTFTFSAEYEDDFQPPMRELHPTLVEHEQKERAKERDDVDHREEESTAPEPTTVTLKAPTCSESSSSSLSTAAAATVSGTPTVDSHVLHATAIMTSDVARTGPPMPIPEPTAADTDSSSAPFAYHDHYEWGPGPGEEGLPATTVYRETRAVADDVGERQGQSKRKKMRRVKKVTTLIIETLTIIKHPPKETLSMHSQRPAKEDHVMFDAGIEGDMVVSIANDEDSQRRQKQGSRSNKNLRTRTRQHVNDEL